MTKIKRLILFGFVFIGAAFSARGASFPSTVTSDSILMLAKNNCGTLLTAAITSGATTISVGATSCFPTVGYITIDEEAILCTGKTATTFTGCTRGSDGTTAASHVSGSGVDHFVIAAHHNLLKDEIIAMSAYFLSGSEVHIDTTTTKDSLYLGTTSGNSHLTVWGTGTTNVVSFSTNTSGSPEGFAFTNAGNVTINQNATVGGTFDVTGAATVGGSLGVTGAATAATLNTGQGANELYDMDQNVQTTDAVVFVTVNTGQGANELYDMDQNVQTTDPVVFTTLNTGQGANELYAMNQNVQTTNAVTFLTVDTGQGANELYDMDQNVQTTDAVVFATINTGQGVNELYGMDQAVKTSDSPTFVGATFSGLTASRAVQTNGSKALESSAVTTTELGYLSGVTSAIQTQINTLAGSNDGWTAFGVTLSTVSSTSFSVPGDYSTILTVGDRIKLTQTTAKYFNVLTVTAGVGVTTVTVTGGTDYTIASAAITLPYFSHSLTVNGFPQWFAYTPTWTGSVSNPVVNDGTLTGRFSMQGKLVVAKINLTMGAGTTYGSGQWRMTFPIATTAYSETPDTQVGGVYLKDAGAANYTGWCDIVTGSDGYIGLTYQNATSGGLGAVTPTAPFTFASTDNIGIQFQYEIQ